MRSQNNLIIDKFVVLAERFLKSEIKYNHEEPKYSLCLCCFIVFGFCSKFPTLHETSANVHCRALLWRPPLRPTEASCRVLVLQVNVGAAAALPVSCEDAAEGGSAWPCTLGPRPGGAGGARGRPVCPTMSTSLLSQPGKF